VGPALQHAGMRTMHDCTAGRVTQLAG
jgi:hypothetical protein